MARTGISVFMYHDLGDDASTADAWQVVRVSDFLRQVEYLRSHYDIVSLDEALAHAAAGRALTVGGRPSAVLTFDDGLRGNAELLLPRLRSEQLPVTIYVATGQVESGQSFWFDRLVNAVQCREPIEVDLHRFGLERYRLNESHGANNWARIHALLVAIKARPEAECEAIVAEVERQLTHRLPPVLVPMTVGDVQHLAECPFVTIGAHTHGHEVLTLLSEAQGRHTIDAAGDRLTAWIGQRPRHFAYPAGFHDERVRRWVADAGYVSAVTTEEGVWRSSASAMAIPRISVGRYDDLRRFKFNSWRHL